MRRLSIKWTRVSIKYKLFLITTSLLLALATILYLFLCFLLPSYYHNYKMNNLKESVQLLHEVSPRYDTEYLKTMLAYISGDQNLSILLKDENGRIEYSQRYERYLVFQDPLNNSSNLGITMKDRRWREYKTTIELNTNDYDGHYILEIVMPLQPIDDASHVIRSLMPYITLLAVFIAVIGAYIYSKTITKPLIDIIEKEREEEVRRKEFVATISHELKTPITIISGQLEGMIYNIGKYKDRDTYLKKSYDSTQELKDLVNEMMEVSKADILESDLNLKAINLSELLNQLGKRQTFLVEDNHLKLNFEIEKNIIVNVDEEKMIKVINNIINNAIKYTPKGENVIVRLYRKVQSKGYKKTNGVVFLEVENTGVKIDENHLIEIFNPFYRIEKSRSRKTGGSGLGLYIVSKILKRHGFKYSIKNKVNSVIFTIEI